MGLSERKIVGLISIKLVSYSREFSCLSDGMYTFLMIFMKKCVISEIPQHGKFQREKNMKFSNFMQAQSQNNKKMK